MISLATAMMLPKIGEILIDRGSVSPDVVNNVLENKKENRRRACREEHCIKGPTLEAALLEQEHLKKIQSKQAGFETEYQDKYRRKLDDFCKSCRGTGHLFRPSLISIPLIQTIMSLQILQNLFRGLQKKLRDSVLGVRMIPVGQTFGVFRRLVRDLSD